jgi:hypothetical protein
MFTWSPHFTRQRIHFDPPNTHLDHIFERTPPHLHTHKQGSRILKHFWNNYIYLTKQENSYARIHVWFCAMHTSSQGTLSPTSEFVKVYFSSLFIISYFNPLSPLHSLLLFSVCKCVPLFDAKGGCPYWNIWQMMLINILVFLPLASRDEHTHPPKRTSCAVFEWEENHLFRSYVHLHISVCNCVPLFDAKGEDALVETLHKCRCYLR